jgi:hypothetical protein
MQAPNNPSNGKFKRLVPIIVVLLVVGTGVNALMNVGVNTGYAPDQPIPFSHKLHAGQYNIPCMYCHVGVEKSKHATVPSMNICMNCHSVVKPDSPYIQKLKQLYNEKKEPFQWIKVHDLPDFVNFNHKRHVLKGIACETCHGEVKRMMTIRQEHPLNMGWCMDCHRGVTAPAHLARVDAEHAKGTGVEPGGVAPTSCYTCHH